MFAGDQISGLVEALEEREVCLSHACQFQDVLSYLELQSIPSRRALAQARLPFTAFDTDASDRMNEVWDKVFLNLADFGAVFANGGHSVPNPYGPIVFQLRPRALLEAADVAICLRSAGTEGFSRDDESLSSSAELQGLFSHPATAGFPESSYIAGAHHLVARFGHGAQTPELSLTVPKGAVSFDANVVAVIVDPYGPPANGLKAAVTSAVYDRGNRWPISERPRNTERGALYRELGGLISRGVRTSPELAGSKGTAPFAEWRDEILANPNVVRQFPRYARYLADGTLSVLEGLAK